MLFAISLTLGFILFVWLVFFKFRWLKLTPAWAIVTFIIFLHVLLIFVIGLRFVTPYTTQAVVIQHTIQLVPRLDQPTLVTAVLAEPNVPVKKGDPLFQFDRTTYENNVKQLEADLAAAVQNVKALEADVRLTRMKADHALAQLEFQNINLKSQTKLYETKSISIDQYELAVEQQRMAQAAYLEAESEAARATVKADSKINGVNTTVASLQAQLGQARFYLDNTLMRAPEDGKVVNLQVQPGMVSGELRAGAIASFVCDADRYLLASFTQESLKYVKVGQPVEVALDLYPGQIFSGKVKSIWRFSGAGQLLPTAVLPAFEPQPPEKPQGNYAVQIVFDDPDQAKFTIGAQGAAAVYTSGLNNAWAALRRIGIRTYSWLNWLYPLSF